MALKRLKRFDMVYHLDKQLQDFMEQITTKFDKKDVLFALTADHGSGQIVELMHDRGLDSARRISASDLLTFNQYLKKTHGVDNCVLKIKQPHCHLNMKVFDTLDRALQEKIMQISRHSFCNNRVSSKCGRMMSCILYHLIKIN